MSVLCVRVCVVWCVCVWVVSDVACILVCMCGMCVVCVLCVWCVCGGGDDGDGGGTQLHRRNTRVHNISVLHFQS